MLYILPTDTCYGIAGDITQEDFEKIYELKNRKMNKKLAFLVRDFDELERISLVTQEQKQILQNYPFPFSVLLSPNPYYYFPEFIKISNYSLISVRIGEKCLPKNILEKIDFPLFLTSANISGEKEATTFTEAKKIFSDINGFDNGICNSPSSNIFSFGTNNELHYLRQNYF